MKFKSSQVILQIVLQDKPTARGRQTNSTSDWSGIRRQGQKADGFTGNQTRVLVRDWVCRALKAALTASETILTLVWQQYFLLDQWNVLGTTNDVKYAFNWKTERNLHSKIQSKEKNHHNVQMIMTTVPIREIQKGTESRIEAMF